MYNLKHLLKYVLQTISLNNYCPCLLPYSTIIMMEEFVVFINPLKKQSKDKKIKKKNCLLICTGTLKKRTYQIYYFLTNRRVCHK